MGGFEQCTFVTNVGSRCDTNTTNLCSQRIGDVVTVQVHTSDNVVLSGTQQDLLQERIGDNVLNHDLFTGFRVLDFNPRTAIDQFTTEFFTRQLITPVFERAFGEFHNVTFMNQGNRITIVSDGVLNCCTNQTLGPFFGTRLDTDTAMFREADFLHAHLFAQEFNHFLSISGVRFPLNTCIDIF